MADEQENVDAGSETSGAEAAETSQETTVAETTEVSTETTADAGDAAVTENGEQIANPEIGSVCTAPDGRPGTIQAGSEEGTLICLPNA